MKAPHPEGTFKGTITEVVPEIFTSPSARLYLRLIVTTEHGELFTTLPMGQSGSASLAAKFMLHLMLRHGIGMAVVARVRQREFDGSIYIDSVIDLPADKEPS